MRVTEGVRKIIVEWHGKGVPPEETARSLRIPIDEVKAIILQAHPAPAPEKPAGIGVPYRRRSAITASTSRRTLRGNTQAYIRMMASPGLARRKGRAFSSS